MEPSRTDQPLAKSFNGGPPSHSVPMLLPVFILFFILLCFLSIFLFRDLLHYASAWLVRSEGAGGGDGGRGLAGGREAQGEPAGGVNPVIIASFPTLPYSAVRGVQEGKCGSECAVCLADFSEGDVIWLLTVCCHAFHLTCIDSWLASHPHNLPRLPFRSRGAARRGCIPGGEGGHRRQWRGRPCDRRSGRGWGGAVGSDAEIALQEPLEHHG